MTTQEQLIYLTKENHNYQQLSVPSDLNTQKLLLRALLNGRGPKK